MCTFHWDDTIKKYMARPFAFYVFPKSKITDQAMLFQANAISFLVGNKFDFKKLFNEAVTFARAAEFDDL